MQEELDRLEAIERYLILLLGVVDRPIPSKEHIQKELFVLSRANRIISEIFKFEGHYEGPFSPDLAEILESPVYFANAFARDKRGYWLTEKGKKIYDELVQKYYNDEKFRALLAAMKMARKLYNDLSVEELLFLIYVTYPEYREKSIRSKELLSKKRELAKRLLEKGLITEKRFMELISYDNSSRQ